MEQRERKRAHLERVLLVCGHQNSGKSRLLRHMLGDKRLGGSVPTSGVLKPRPLSRERCLAGRFASPHEKNEHLSEFIKSIDDACSRAWNDGFWRINYASAIQPRPFSNMPDVVEVCKEINDAFWPERIRVVVLSPDQAGLTKNVLTTSEIDGLRAVAGGTVEVLTIDARRSSHPAEPGNVRILADYFDFS